MQQRGAQKRFSRKLFGRGNRGQGNYSKKPVCFAVRRSMGNEYVIFAFPFQLHHVISKGWFSESLLPTWTLHSSCFPPRLEVSWIFPLADDHRQHRTCFKGSKQACLHQRIIFNIFNADGWILSRGWAPTSPRPVPIPAMPGEFILSKRLLLFFWGAGVCGAILEWDL